MTTKEELQDKLYSLAFELENTKRRLLDLFEQMKKEKTEERPHGLWKPKEGEKYWAILPSRAGIDYFINASGDDVDLFNFSIGNCYPTQEAAEQHLEHLKVETQLRNIAERLNRGREIDWTDDFDKYYLVVNCYTNLIDWGSDRRFKRQGVIYCLDENFKDVAIQEIGEDRLKEYLKEC